MNWKKAMFFYKGFFGNIAGYVQSFGHFANFVHNFGHISIVLFIIWVILEIFSFLFKFDHLKIAKFWKKLQNFQKYSIIEKLIAAISDNIILHNLVKFQLSRSFWTWVISNFVKYQKMAILRFCQFFHPNWSKFSIL